MKAILYLLFSGTEWLALILLTFAMFKFRLKGYWGQIILTSASMSLLSHFIFQGLQMRELATILQPPALFLFFWQMFRIQIFYAALMTVYGYMAYSCVQMLLIIVEFELGIDPNKILPNTLPIYILQTVSILFVLLIVALLYKYRVGYTFVPDSEYAPVRMKGLNLRLLFLTIAGFGCLAVTNFVTFSSHYPAIFILLISVVLGILLYNAQRKERTDD